MNAYQTVTDATRIWIKGKEFSIAKLLGGSFKHLAPEYEGGSLAIFRLAPQDYHRYHSPVDGRVAAIKKIDGEYYTVNPSAFLSSWLLMTNAEQWQFDPQLTYVAQRVQALKTEQVIRSTATTSGKSSSSTARPLGASFTSVSEPCWSHRLRRPSKKAKMSSEAAKWATLCVVFISRWLILTLLQAFGGSTIICLFQPGKCQFDDDILENSSKAIETLVRVGMRIGSRPE
jgi:phosphatidylserine decarboxylase